MTNKKKSVSIVRYYNGRTRWSATTAVQFKLRFDSSGPSLYAPLFAKRNRFTENELCTYLRFTVVNTRGRRIILFKLFYSVAYTYQSRC